MADLPTGNGDFPAVPSHGGQYIQYNIFGNLFEITNKYRPPIMPIGRGAYGIVWYVVSRNREQLFDSFFSFGLLIEFFFFDFAAPCWIRRRTRWWRSRKSPPPLIITWTPSARSVRLSCFVIWIMKMWELCCFSWKCLYWTVYCLSIRLWLLICMLWHEIEFCYI